MTKPWILSSKEILIYIELQSPILIEKLSLASRDVYAGVNPRSIFAHFVSTADEEWVNTR